MKSVHKFGFTIVELLIVVVVIAVLAAITIVAFAGIQERARESAAQAAAKQVGAKIMTHAVENSEKYPEELSEIGISNSSSTNYQYAFNNSSNPATFCVTATTQNKSYYISNTVTTSTAGGCDGHGRDGVAAITNLAVNPDTSGGNWFGAINSGAATRSYESVGGPSGIVPTFYRMTITTPPTNAVPYILHGQDSLSRAQPVAGQPLSVSIWARSNRPAAVRILAVASSIGGGEWNSLASGDVVTVTPNVWTKLTASVGSWPAGSTVAATRILVETRNTVPGFWAVNDTLDVTALMVTATATLHEYADGNTENWIWNGTPGNSTSTGPPL